MPPAAAERIRRERAQPFVDYSHGRLGVRCPNCDHVEYVDLRITTEHREDPAGDWLAVTVRPQPIPHTCGPLPPR